jgi:hypothetical protein
MADPITQPQRQGLLGGFFGPQGRDTRQRLALALEGLTQNPNQALIGQIQTDIQDRKAEGERNRTLEWLSTLNTPEAQRALQYAQATGDVVGAAKMAMTPADPMAAINLEKAQIELQRLKDGIDMDPNVQSSAPLPDQSGVVLTMRDGSVQVRTVGGELLSGQPALDYVRKSQEQAAEYQRSIYGARREGTLGAEAAAAAPGELALFNTIEFQVNDLLNDPYLPNMLGPVQGRLPNVSAEAARVQGKMNQISGGAFLQARQLLKGGGAITDFESRKAEEAFLLMNTAQNEEDFRKAMQNFLDAVRAGLPKLQTAAPAAGGVATPEGLSQDDLRYLGVGSN